MKEKFPYQLVDGNKIEVNGEVKTVKGVKMVENKICKVYYHEGGFGLIPFIKKVKLSN